MNRPEWVKCIVRTFHPTPDGKDARAVTLWCGRTPDTFDWHFQSIDHGIIAAETGRLQPCHECVKAARDACDRYLSSTE